MMGGEEQGGGLSTFGVCLEPVFSQISGWGCLTWWLRRILRVLLRIPTAVLLVQIGSLNRFVGSKGPRVRDPVSWYATCSYPPTHSLVPNCHRTAGQAMAMGSEPKVDELFFLRRSRYLQRSRPSTLPSQEPVTVEHTLVVSRIPSRLSRSTHVQHSLARIYPRSHPPHPPRPSRFVR